MFLMKSWRAAGADELFCSRDVHEADLLDEDVPGEDRAAVFDGEGYLSDPDEQPYDEGKHWLLISVFSVRTKINI